MDLIKIGKFISEKRKAKNLTQIELAEKLHVTDRAISKWECGRSMPDSSMMLELCDLLGISVNELLTGEELEMKEYNQQAEKNLLEITKQKEESDRRLLRNEIIMGIVGVILMIVCVGTGAYLMKTYEELLWLAITLICVGLVELLVMALFALRIEQKAGYYECAECGTRYVPSYFRVLIAPHVNRTRYMKCPHCGKHAWHKKVISENKE